MASKVRVLITTGDPDGIGGEVTHKALRALGPKNSVQFIYYRHAPGGRPRRGLNSRGFKCQVVYSLDEAHRTPFDHRTLLEVQSPHPAAAWVEEGAAACLRGQFHALVTAPLSKTSILAAGLKDIGHTEILSRLSGVQNLFMGFVGKHFSVVLATGHQPLARALKELNAARLGGAVQAANHLRQLLPATKRSLPMALVALNPHAGEMGIIGREEFQFKKTLTKLKADFSIEGPLVPDAAFLPQNWKRYSVYISPYHDQGLIPFKLVHGFNSGVHLTLGLPFVRTSVDHGTAKELFGKDKAQFGSMKDALLFAIRLSREQSL